MKIKIVGRWSNLPITEISEIVYDIYYGFSGLPATFPFCTKWKLDKASLTEDELLKWFKKQANAYQEIIIKL